MDTVTRFLFLFILGNRLARLPRLLSKGTQTWIHDQNNDSEHGHNHGPSLFSWCWFPSSSSPHYLIFLVLRTTTCPMVATIFFFFEMTTSVSKEKGGLLLDGSDFKVNPVSFCSLLPYPSLPIHANNYPFLHFPKRLHSLFS